MNTNEDKTDRIVVRTGCCKHIIFTSVCSRPLDAETMKEIGEMIKEGCSVEHMPVYEVRRSDFGCKCNPKPTVQPELI